MTEQSELDLALYFDIDGNQITLKEWATKHSDEKYVRIGSTFIGDVWISTVWIGIDHAISFSELPIIFETMVFGGELDGEQDRYCTKQQAEAGHETMVRRAQEVSS